ncbi:hypothetical protein cand_003520 [Cryptosporidium andersoni]|uniref:Uncharacterized protein n=1 Tax=Cryptosporidium andersoni TaxID=117008 RepID=A0A1J4MGB6_9CRYT|nr:hypothetical protein cand_003520 [Cryptosporidium andersoni]
MDDRTDRMSPPRGRKIRRLYTHSNYTCENNVNINSALRNGSYETVKWDDNDKYKNKMFCNKVSSIIEDPLTNTLIKDPYTTNLTPLQLKYLQKTRKILSYELAHYKSGMRQFSSIPDYLPCDS